MRKKIKQNYLRTRQNNQTQKTIQIQRKYILSSIKSGIVLINQTSAHQRILYEEFLENYYY